MPITGEYEPSTWQAAREQAETYEATGGREAGLRKGVPIIVMTNVGAKSGKLRKTALMRVEREGTYVVVASMAGAPTHPAWYWNLVAHPHVELQDGNVKKDYRARLLEGAEYETWWQRCVDVWPAYADYQAQTDRKIPVFVLEEME